MVAKFKQATNWLCDNRLLVILPLQVLIIAAAFLLAFSIRFDFSIPPQYWPLIGKLLPPLLLIKMVCFWKTGLFRGWWRYVSMPDLVQILKGNLLASLIFVGYAVIVYRFDQIPRSVLLLDTVFCLSFIAGIRFLTRAIRESTLLGTEVEGVKKTRILVVGAGDAGQMIVREVRSNRRLDLDVVGYVDDDPQKRNGLFQGVKVLGSQRQLTEIVHNYNVAEVIITIPSATGSQIRQIVERCRPLDVKIKTLPGVGDLIAGNVSVQELREVKLEDLLGRKPISLDQAQISSYLRGKRVLVTGAGGSIGGEICRQVARFEPECLILFENAETPLFFIEQELIVAFPHIHVVPIIGDVRNPSRVKVIFDEQMPQVVFHAAAYKHVPMMENNPAEAINNNVRGTQILANAADEMGVETFVMISTDKAVRPTNVMGASKRVAELYVQSLARFSKTRFVTTRFGNVLGSSGSVIPTFKDQIRKGGPVTVTHPEVTRFFMTSPEASQLVLQAGSMGKGGEIYLFDMGAPVKIKDLAEELIRLSGFKPYEDIGIVYTGLRPGEKLYEELLLEGEGVLPTHHNKICIASSAPPPKDILNKKIEELIIAAKVLDLPGIRAGLKGIVPEYQSAEHKQSAKVIPLPTSVVHQ